MIHQTGLGLDHLVRDLGFALLLALGESPIPGVDTALVEADLGSVLDLLEDLGARGVDQHDAVGDDGLGAEVRVSARYRRGGVDDGQPPRLDERVCRQAIQVEFVENDDISRTDTLEQLGCVAIDPGDTADPGQRILTT